MKTPSRWILRNIARRPVELHGADGVEIIPPGGSIETATIGPHCAALLGRGLLTKHEAPPPEPGDDSAADAAPAKPRRRAAAKSSDSKPASPKPAKPAAKGGDSKPASPKPAKPAAKGGDSKPASPRPAKPAAKGGKKASVTGLRKGDGE